MFTCRPTNIDKSSIVYSVNYFLYILLESSQQCEKHYIELLSSDVQVTHNIFSLCSFLIAQFVENFTALLFSYTHVIWQF